MTRSKALIKAQKKYRDKHREDIRLRNRERQKKVNKIYLALKKNYPDIFSKIISSTENNEKNG